MMMMIVTMRMMIVMALAMMIMIRRADSKMADLEAVLADVRKNRNNDNYDNDYIMDHLEAVVADFRKKHQ